PYLSGGADLLPSLARFGSSGEFLSLLGTFRITTFDTALSRNLTAALLVLVVSALAWRRRSFVAFTAGAFEALILLMPIVHYWYLSWMILVMPFAVRVRWCVAALLMVGYFEANRVQENTGEWVLPFWPRLVVWIGFLAAVLLERFRPTAPRGIGREDYDRLVDAG
ncbi:hypothetical protein IIA29_11720, partial [candidate division KSB1 bacterium]|nr:hypothetical protein [candidate division KSB1 bacterium]